MRALLGVPALLRRSTAWVAVLALCVSALGPVLHGVHDLDCEPAVVVHDPSQHRFDASPPPDETRAGGDHCVACHFQRTSRGSVSWELNGTHTLASGGLLWHSDGSTLAPPDASPQPARAPPAA